MTRKATTPKAKSSSGKALTKQIQKKKAETASKNEASKIKAEVLKAKKTPNKVMKPQSPKKYTKTSKTVAKEDELFVAQPPKHRPSRVAARQIKAAGKPPTREIQKDEKQKSSDERMLFGSVLDNKMPAKKAEDSSYTEE